MVRFFLFQSFKHLIHWILKGFIILAYFHRIQEFNQCCKVLLFQRCLIVDITNQSTIQQGLRLRPEFVTGLAVPFGVGNEGCGQLQNILFAVNIREGIIMHRLSEIDSIENPDTVSVLQKGLAAVDYDIAFRVSDHIGTVAL